MKHDDRNCFRWRRRPAIRCGLLLCLLLCLTACSGAAESTRSAEAVQAPLAVEAPASEAEPEPESMEASASEEESASDRESASDGESASDQESAEPEYETATVIASALNMRKKATTDSAVIEQLKMGTKVTVLGAGKYWAKILTEDHKIGYVSVDYLFIGQPDVRPYEILQEAKKYLGTPYVWSGSSPSGFDCSGFTQYVYIQLGMYLPRIADDQFDMGTPVEADELQIGDLVFFGSGTYASHVGIYAGDGNFIHASNQGVTITSLKLAYYAQRYIGARRIRED